MLQSGGRQDEVVASISLQFEGRTTVGLAKAANILGMCVKTLKAHLSRREIGCLQIGFGKQKKRRMFTVRDLADFIERRRRFEDAGQSELVLKMRVRNRRRRMS